MATGKDAESVVHRLDDMLVEEVSLVDRAANRRKFLLVKRDTTMGAGAPITAKPDGSFTATGGGGAAPAPNTVAAAPAAGSAPRAKASVALTDETKSAMTDVLEGAIASLSDALDLVKGAKSVDPDPAAEEPMEPGALLDLVGEVLGELEDAVMAAFGAEDDALEGEGSATPAAPGAPAPVAANAPPLAKRLEVARAKRVISKSQVEQIGRDLVAKYGTKMKKERFARFQTALSTLVALAGELMPPGVTKTRAPAPAAAPAAAEKPKAGVTKADAAPVDIATHPVVVELQKQLKAAAEKLSSIEKSVQPSNAAPVDASGRTKASDVSWPMDMNDDRFGNSSDPNYFGR